MTLTTVPWFRSVAVAATAIAALAVPTFAQEQEGKSFDDHLVAIIDAATASTEVDHRVHLETLSCGEFVSITSSGAETDRAVAAMIMVWAHGYHSGLKGIDFEARPVSLEAMVDLTKRTIDECSHHPDMLFHSAITKVD
jgi:hypothetical protein